jgi:hypothetical protein
MEIHPPPIGASMLHLLGDAAPGTETTTPVPTTRPHPPLHTVSHTLCLLRSYHSRSIMLQGPPKSGKTSVAMDLAYSSASSAGCLGGCGSSCSCVAAILYRTADSEHDDFPLQCLVKEEETTKEFSTRYHQLDMPTDWEPQVLKRIRIRYVQSVRDVLADLLATPLMQQPLGAIVIDDIDRMASKESNPTSAMMQLCTYEKIMTKVPLRDYKNWTWTILIVLLFHSIIHSSGCRRHQPGLVSFTWNFPDRLDNLGECSRGTLDGIDPFHSTRR